MKVVLVLTIAFLAFSATTRSPLQEYVNTEDPTFYYELVDFQKTAAFTLYTVNLTSQTWLSSAESDRPVWTHWLQICIPVNVDRASTSALLFVDGGDNSLTPPTLGSVTQALCASSQAVVANLRQIPNQPIVFTQDGTSRTEDAIIAYTWYQFLQNTSAPNWLLRFPMTKAVVRAMDVITCFKPNIKNFVLSGASKRGWAVWTTAIVDKRVIGIIPLVIPILNMIPNINNHYQSLGEWSYAFYDYVAMGILAYLNKPEFRELANIEDPFSYLSKLKMPKYIVAATGDQFFTPDSTQFFYNRLWGTNYLRLVPNVEHSLFGAEISVLASVVQFYKRLVRNQPLPNYSFQLFKSEKRNATITVTTTSTPAQVLLWSATTLSETKRDFRLLTCPNPATCYQPVMWTSEPLQSLGNGVYFASKAPPAKGWTGFFIELTYLYGPSDVFTVTSEVNIVPNTLPFPKCGDNCQ